MDSLQRMNAAIHGEPFDRYPYINPYPFWSMQPHWPELNGKTFLHVNYGSDDERLDCYRALVDKLGLDWLPISLDAGGRDNRYSIEIDDDDGTTVLIDKSAGTRAPMLIGEYGKDTPITKRTYHSGKDVEDQPDGPSIDDLVARSAFTQKAIKRFGSEIFTVLRTQSPFSVCFRGLTFEGLFEAILTEPELVHAISERATEEIIRFGLAGARVGANAVHINEYPAGAELLSDKHYLEFIFPYEQRIFRAFREAGLVTMIEYLGWVEPRLPHLAKLDLDCLHTESSLKGYTNRVEEYRRVLGDEICIFSNSNIYGVIERGDEETWRRDAVEQAKGIGGQQRFIIGAGSPTTRETGPERLRRYGEFMQSVLAEISPPRG